LRTILKRAAWLILSLTILASFSPGVFCQSSDSPAGQKTLDMQGYIAELDRCSAVLNNPGKDPAAFRKLRVTLPTQWTVQAGEQRYTVSTDWLEDALAIMGSGTSTNTPLRPQTEKRLAALRDAARRLEESAGSQDLQRSRAQLDRVMSAREFRGAHGPSWFDVLRNRIYAWISREIEKLLDRIGISRSIGNVIAWTLISLAALLLAVWAIRFLIRRTAQPQMGLEGASRPGRDWRDWLRDARAASERGDYRAAIHAAYWVAVARLEETKLLPQDRSRTPRESLRLIGRESTEYAPLAQLTRRFELVWYGYRPATEMDWSEAMQQLERLGCLRSSTPAIAAS
jgi:hypothetical protein